MVDIDKLRPDLDKLRRPQNAIKLFEFVSQNCLKNVIIYCQLCQLLFIVLALSSKQAPASLGIPRARQSPGFVNFFPALAYHFCLALPAAFTQPGDHLLAEPCSEGEGRAAKFSSPLLRLSPSLPFEKFDETRILAWRRS